MNIQTAYTPRFAVTAHDTLSSLREHMLIDGFDHIIDLERSHGSWLVEARTGKEYLDFFTCIASMPIGMNHPKMTDPAFVEYLGRVALNKPSNSDIYTAEMATFVKTFFNLAVPKHFRYAFFIDGGTLAVENALKTAIDWKVRKNFAKGHKEEKGHQIMHFELAFHGRSGYCMSLTNTDPTKTSLWPRFHWPRISPPFMSFPANEQVVELVAKHEEIAIREIKRAFSENVDDIAAIIIEPIQGEGGDNHFRPEFLQKLRTICDEHEALLIFDEVQTGVGITGTWWAHEGIGVVPDIMSFGKKMQVCGILVGPRVDEVPDNVFHTSSRINSTWGGSLVDMVRATKYLEIIDEENLVQNAATVGAYLRAQLRELATTHGDYHITNVRGAGLFCAFDLPTKEERNAFLKRAYENQLLLVGSGNRSVRFRPPLNLSKEEVDIGMGLIEKSIST
ncbi:MAG: L-lysine 6-transaminase [Candidatus Kapabacteria bacterium]|nr:L-lysine 6-transaminase [Candidatus Kapabacteria bacterium]